MRRILISLILSICFIASQSSVLLFDGSTTRALEGIAEQASEESATTDATASEDENEEDEDNCVPIDECALCEYGRAQQEECRATGRRQKFKCNSGEYIFFSLFNNFFFS